MYTKVKEIIKSKRFVFSLVLMIGGFASALGGTLEWIGASGGTWDTTTQNWQDENGDPSVWVDGSTAVFGDLGGSSIAVSGTVNLGGLVFKGATAPTISGGTLAFASQMPIDLQSDKGAIITSALTIPGGFVAKAERSCEWTDLLPCKGVPDWDWLTGVPVTLWKNRRLEEIDIVSANMFTFRMTPLPVKAYNHTWMNGKLRVQFQYKSESEGIYCVIVDFAQDGDDITACVYRCRVRKYDTQNNLLSLGDDFVALDAAGRITSGYTKVLDGVLFTQGLGLKDIVAEPKAPLQFNGAWSTPVGACVVSNCALQVTGRQHTFDTGDSFLGNGTMIVKNTSTSSFTFRFNNSFTNGITGRFIVDGAQLYLYGNGNFKANRAFGPGCQIRVVNGGMINAYRWAHESFGGNGNFGTSLYIGTNSMLKSTLSNHNIKYLRTVVDGGTINFVRDSQFSGSPSYQIADLTLRNGAQVIQAGTDPSSLIFGIDGRNITKTPRLIVDGEDEVTVADRIRIMIDGNAGSWSGDNQYTTFDTRADLRLTGGIMTAPPSSDSYTVGRRLRKCGAAKLIFDYSQDDYPADSQRENSIEICVDRGALELRRSNSVVATQALSLYGEGTVASAANVSTDVALLTVGGTNTIDFAVGSVLTCTNLTFTAAAKKLNLTGEVGDRSFRVGTSKCLTNAQLAQVRINGHHAVQTQDGYLVLAGLTIVVR